MALMEGKAPAAIQGVRPVDAFPLCLDTTDVDEIVGIVRALAPTFGDINPENMPRCFEIERRLRSELNIPAFHDDQHAQTAVPPRPDRNESSCLTEAAATEAAVDQPTRRIDQQPLARETQQACRVSPAVPAVGEHLLHDIEATIAPRTWPRTAYQDELLKQPGPRPGEPRSPRRHRLTPAP